MEIKDRLKKIIESENLTSSAFADIIGVQRSSISHILSGRNKPGMDFIQKILTAFPKYKAEWLVMGTGEIYKQPMQPTLFDTEKTALNTENTEDKNNELSPDTIESTAEIQNILPNNNITQQKDIDNKENTAINDNNKKNDQNDSRQQKHAIKIVIFYSDKTFSEYYPE